MAKKNRKQMRESLRKRTQEQTEKSQGGSGKGFFKDNLQNVKFWSCKEGDHLIDIIPYNIGENDPRLSKFSKRNELQVGDPHYVLEVFAHYDVGPSEQSCICLAETYNKPCPICEHRKQLIKEGADEGVVNELKVSRYPRVIYNIVSLETADEEAKGIQVFHTSSYLMETNLAKLAKGPVRPGQTGIDPYIYFADPDEGKSISFSREGKGQNTRFTAHRFLDRNYEIEDEILDAAYCLDDLIYIPTYDEVYEMYWGEAKESVEEKLDEVKKAVSDKRERKAKKEIFKEGQSCPEFGKSFGKLKDCDECLINSNCEEKQNQEKVQENDCEDFGKSFDEFEECEDCGFRAECNYKQNKEEEKPKKSRKVKEEKKPEKEKSITGCSEGYEFGVDTGEKDQCDECSKWDACVTAAGELEKQKEDKPKSGKRRK